MRKVIERALNLLAFLITARRPVTAVEIRRTVAGYDRSTDAAFQRMFERDKELLRGLGVPLELRPTDALEAEFGYVVSAEAYALGDPGLTDEERAALLIAAEIVRFGGQVHGPDALLKLGGAPAVSGGEPLVADLGASDQLDAAFGAISERRELRFVYHGRDRTVAPYGLVHRRGHWYLVGVERGEETVKAFRLDRAGTLEVGDRPGRFEVPEGFDAAALVPEEPWGAGREDVAATVIFDRQVAWLAERRLAGEARLRPRADGTLEVSLHLAAPEAFLGWLVGFGGRAEILEPRELRERFVALVRGDP